MTDLDVLIRVSAGGTLAASLTDGYEPAMLVIGALCALPVRDATAS